MNLNHKEIQQLLQEYCQNEPRREFRDLLSGILLFLCFALVVIFAEFWWLGIIGSLALALLAIRFFELFHEYEHGVILKNSRLARLFFTFYGALVMFPSYVWTYTHNIHHKNVGRLSPEYLGYYPMIDTKTYRAMPSFEKLKYRVFRSSLMVFLSPLYALPMSLSTALKNRKSRRNVIFSVFLYFSAFGVIWYLFGWQKLLLLGILPFVMFTWLGTVLLYLQHNFQGVKYFSGRKNNYLERILGSSNTILSNAFWKWVMCNSGYHLVHHIEPKIPYYRLEEAHRALTEHITVPEMKFTMSNVLECYKQKIFDAELGQTVHWRQLKL